MVGSSLFTKKDEKMRDNLQNIADLIGALAEDIKEIKKILVAKDASDKDEAVKRLAVKLNPVIRFFGDSMPENISGIFKSKETIEGYKKSLGGEMIANSQAYTDANDKDMCKRGILTIKDLLYKILEVLTGHVKIDKRIAGKAQKKKEFTPELWQASRPDRTISGIRLLWDKIPDGWYKNSHAWSGTVCTLVFFALFTVSWMQWYEYLEENRRLRAVADKY